MERGTGFEPAATCLEGRSSTPELPPLAPHSLACGPRGTLTLCLHGALTLTLSLRERVRVRGGIGGVRVRLAGVARSFGALGDLGLCGALGRPCFGFGGFALG